MAKGNPSAGERNQSDTGFHGIKKTMQETGSTRGLKPSGGNYRFQKDDPDSVFTMEQAIGRINKDGESRVKKGHP